ncbi:MAG: PhoH family protein [Clostridia bacterium]|nr:PhoH family protein [Clostridia bacterium]
MIKDTTLKIMLGNNGEAANIFGRQDENLLAIEKAFEIKIVARGGEITLTGAVDEVGHVQQVFQQLQDLVRAGHNITLQDVNYVINSIRQGTGAKMADLANQVIITSAKGKVIKPKTAGQFQYLQAIKKNDIVFGIGPAGTGKTYLAVVMAVAALKNREVGRIILTRPAVEAGEKLGFLPGDLQEKVDPYLRPLYDGLYDVLGADTTAKYIERGIIEVAPLAYMRGRTLDDSFIILDEAQNTTPEQMKMFLTRIGLGSKAVITGDITQVDLPRGHFSGLIEVQNILQGIEGIAFQFLTDVDVVRHHIVQKIIQAYARFNREQKG